MPLKHFLKTLAVVLALSAGITARSMQQATLPAAAELAKADVAFQQNSWQAAADDYRAIVRDDPSNGMAWLRLGMSLEQLGQADDAVSAYGHAVQLKFQTMRAELGIARVQARRGQTQSALEHLKNSAALGAPPAVLDGDPALATLRSLPDYLGIRAKAEAAHFPCRAVHTFDFWVGDFDAKPWNLPGGPSGGQLHNTREYEGCVIVEHWTAAGGNGTGMSMSFYDVNRHAWRMVWDDDSNNSNDFEGSYHDGAMRFEGWVLDENGKRILASNMLQDVTPDLIRHQYSTSSDNGKTWIVRSDGRFVRRKP